MFRSRTAITTLLALGACVAAGTLPARAEAPVAEVSALVGAASAQRADGSVRPLACGDPIYAGDRVVTPEGGGVGMLAGDAYAHVAAASAVQVDRTDAGTANFELQSGRLRVVDAREAGAPLGLAVLEARTRLAGNDTEAYVLAEKVDRYAMLCEYDEPLKVARKQEQVDAGPGECVIAKSREPLYTARAHDDRIPLAGLDACELPRVALGPVAARFATADVAGPPPLPVAFFPGPVDVLGSPLDACEDPGTGCGVAAAPTPPPSLGLGTQPFQPILPPGAAE